MRNTAEILCQLNGTPVVQIAAHRGAELFSFLASRGIDATVVQKLGTSLAVLEMDEGVNLSTVEAVLRQWDEQARKIPSTRKGR